MSRPREPGMTASQAARFRKSFRRWVSYFGETNATVGDALDAYPELQGNRNEGGGSKAVANAMMTDRRLTHQMARRCAVALFLTASRERDLEDESVALNELASILVNCGALRVKRDKEIPALIPPNSIDALARRLAFAPVTGSGIGEKTRKPLYDAIRQCLREYAPAMARSWGDATRQHPIVRREQAEHVVEILTEDAFRDSYLYPSMGPWWGKEFDLLSRERGPELDTAELEIDAATQ